MLRIIFGAQQPALLGCPRSEDERPLGPRARREQPRNLDHRRQAQRIVGGAGLDRPPLRIGRADAVRIPMPAIADRLVGIVCSRSTCRAHCGWIRVSSTGASAVKRRLELDRPEAGVARLPLDRLEIVARALQQ